MEVQIRDFVLSDLEAIKKIHDSTGLDYKFPDLASPLFLVTKVAVVDGIIRACGGAYLQCEYYLWLDPDRWAGPTEKLGVIQQLERGGSHDLWLRGIDCACLYLPPGLARFGKRLESLGFSRDRDGWCSYSKRLTG